MVDHLVSLEVDDERKYVLTKLTRNKEKVESDHNVLITKFNLNWHTYKKHDKNEMYNLKNKQGQTRLKHETSTNRYLSSVFDDETEDLEVSAQRFIKRLNKLIQICFKKIRITNKPDKKTDQLYKRWRKLQGQDDEVGGGGGDLCKGCGQQAGTGPRRGCCGWRGCRGPVPQPN